MHCKHCESTKLHNKGLGKFAGDTIRRYQCLDCGRYTNFLDGVVVQKQQEEKKEDVPKQRTKAIGEEITELGDYQGIVVTSVLNDTKIFTPFWENLKAYCEHHNYKLMVIRNKYMNPSIINPQDGVTWPKECIPHFLDTTFRYKDKFKVIGDCNIVATASNPLSGIDGLSEGITTIVGHPVLQMHTLPVNKHKDHVILHSTGSVSMKTSYSSTKAGYRASFHHCYGALVVEIDKENDKFHLRQLLADKSGTFHDLDSKWEFGQCSQETIDAIYLGDEHVLFADPKVSAATFSDNGIVDTLQPKYIVRGDVLDMHSASHHHVGDFFTNYKKHLNGSNSVSHELFETVDYLESTTPAYAVSKIILGNHESHFDKWLNNSDPKEDVENARLYYHLMHLKIEDFHNKNKPRSAFEIYIDEIFKPQTRIEMCEDGFSLHGINLSMHGDKGVSGSRSTQSLAKIGEKAIVGHTHSPAIIGGLWIVGTSSKLQLEYNTGPSKWMHCHAIVHKNGKRQMIFIIDGDWRKV